jgi:hypothetical protein
MVFWLGSSRHTGLGKGGSDHMSYHGKKGNDSQQKKDTGTVMERSHIIKS